MTAPARPPHGPSGTRRYLIHLSCTHDQTNGELCYVVRIQPWSPRSSPRPNQAQERIFRDEYELVEVVNPLLPSGSDLRHVLAHIESAEGFLYLLHLNPEQASTLGWRDAGH